MNNKKINVTAIISGEGSKSAKMKAMYEAGMGIGEIAKAMGVRYNFAYNVISNQCHKDGTEIRVSKTAGAVKAKVIALLEQGKNLTEIQKETGTNYNYCWKLRKEWEASRG